MIIVLGLALKNLWAGSAELQIVLLIFYVQGKGLLLDFEFLIAIMVVWDYSLSFIDANLESRNDLYFI
jgi:hypothetical protein